MVSLEQIQLLESRVQKAVRKIEALNDENETLRDRLGRYEKRIQELEVLINEFKDSQTEIEQGILNALSQLDDLEDQVTESDQSPPAAPSGKSAETANPAQSSNTSGEPAEVPEPEKPRAPADTGANNTGGGNRSPDASNSSDEKSAGPENGQDEEQSAELDIF